MAAVPKSVAHASIGTDEVSIYTVPAGKVAIVLGLRATNVLPTPTEGVGASETQIIYSLRLVKAAGGSNTAYLACNVPVPHGSADAVTGGEKHILQAGDSIVAISDKPASLDVLFSFVEQDI